MAALLRRSALGLVAVAALWGSPAFALGAADAVSVNGTAVTRAELDRMIAETKAQYAGRFGIDFKSQQGQELERELKATLVSQLVERTLILDEARRRNVQVTDKDIEAEFGEIRGNFETDAEFQRALKDNGIDDKQLRANIRDGLTIRQVMDLVAPVTIAAEAIAKFYQENLAQFTEPEAVRVSHILVADEKKGKELLAQLKKGADFATLATKHSEDDGSKAQGGDLGFFPRDRMVPEFEAAAFRLNKGELSGLVKTQFGYHILKGVDRRAARTAPLAEVKAQISEHLGKEQQQAAFGTWLTAQRQKAKVEYQPELDPANAPKGTDHGHDHDH